MGIWPLDGRALVATLTPSAGTVRDTLAGLSILAGVTGVGRVLAAHVHPPSLPDQTPLFVGYAALACCLGLAGGWYGRVRDEGLRSVRSVLAVVPALGPVALALPRPVGRLVLAFALGVGGAALASFQGPDPDDAADAA